MIDIVKKLKFKDLGIILNAPDGLESQFMALGHKSKLDKKAKSSNTLVFVNNKKEFINFLENKLIAIENDSVLWFAYPKGTSKIETDINRDILREAGEAFNLATVTAISIDETWSALRFRPLDRVGT